MPTLLILYEMQTWLWYLPSPEASVSLPHSRSVWLLFIVLFPASELFTLPPSHSGAHLYPFLPKTPGSRLTTPVRAWHCARCAPAAGSRSQP
ncbi:hypothetical protein A6R68_18872 [Neotoma lepida]|uniref:Uncharacterized protein n=1 Tax=Neotoma lepida TaxID=56216 RepID=A0A1A6HKB4_NEOLE|nr:hypothetical protein A6R68_18872 [Neotoma lepida]